MLVIGAGYLAFVWANREAPVASGLIGHGLGIAGFILMVMTETLYSLRKRRRRPGFGRLSAWLKFHIFTGLVGPFMVLLHTSWKFSGLAGFVTLLTIMIVVSGFVGRYLYTSIPRTTEGIEIEAGDLAAARRLLVLWHAVHIPIGMALFTAAGLHIVAALYYATLLK
jgi:hypothetical protein